jgi:hypothetical protein
MKRPAIRILLAVTAIAPDFESARAKSREAAQRVHFDGAHARLDIGWREAARLAAARDAIRDSAQQLASASDDARTA